MLGLKLGLQTTRLVIMTMDGMVFTVYLLLIVIDVVCQLLKIVFMTRVLLYLFLFWSERRVINTNRLFVSFCSLV